MSKPNFKPRHYHGYNYDSLPQCRVQKETVSEISEDIVRLAYAEYHKQHPAQSFERIQERGGFGVHEVIRLLADHIERLKNEK